MRSWIGRWDRENKEEAPRRRIQIWEGFGALFLLVFCSVSQPAQAAFDPAQAFEKKCSSCHTIGGGVLKGPDLKDVNSRHDQAWMIKFIQSSTSVIESGDPAAVKLFNQFKQTEMPDQRLKDREIVELLAFIASGGSAELALDVKDASKAKREDFQLGTLLFLGETRLQNGGPPCVSCHSVGSHGPLGGGTLAKDLTTIYSQHKDKGLSIVLKKMAFPIMGEVFAEHPLTDQEAFALKAFLYDADRTALSPFGFQKKFFFLGLAGLVVGMGVIDLSWRRRRRKSVRRFQGGLR